MQAVAAVDPLEMFLQNGSVPHKVLLLGTMNQVCKSMSMFCLDLLCGLLGLAEPITAVLEGMVNCSVIGKMPPGGNVNCNWLGSLVMLH